MWSSVMDARDGLMREKIKMPHEIVQFADTGDVEPSSVELHWARPEGGGNLQLRFQRHAFGVEGDGIDQYSDQLSRDDCNRLIRALRRARDAVYGADA